MMSAINIIPRILFDFLFPAQVSHPYGSASLPSTSKPFDRPSAENLDSPTELFTSTIQTKDTCLANPDDIADPLVCEADSISELSDATTIFGSDEDSETCSILSSATSEDLANERMECMLTEDDLSIEPDQYPQQVCSQTESESENQRAVAPPSVYVASAVPRRVYSEWDGRREQQKQVVPQWIDDIDADDNYDARYLTPRARDEAECRSLDIWRSARMAVRDLAKVVPLKAHEHPEPRSPCSPSVLKGLGRLSPLRMSWTMDEVVVKRTIFQRSWADEEDDVLEDLRDLKDFFKMRT
jgi:hypothetical protein